MVSMVVNVQELNPCIVHVLHVLSFVWNASAYHPIHILLYCTRFLSLSSSFRILVLYRLILQYAYAILYSVVSWAVFPLKYPWQFTEMEGSSCDLS